ncbi:MAG TPA: exodeoxyribonuclease VII large subunit [Thermotoga sp.]|nr:exodeoxyribonuclease VII large subunit [Thermotoga sp.]
MEGLYSMRYKRVLERMIREGWLTKPKKKLPEYPRKIGVITSRDSAAFQDMLKTIRERYPFVEIYLFHTQVQGEGAKKTLIEAIERSKKYDLDLVIIARGGGSQEDLWIFNEEEVVEALVGIEPPVITGIGHEVDRVLIDLVADFPAHTPTAAAEMAVPNVKEVYRELKETFERIKREFLEKFEDFERKLEDIKRSLWVYQRIFLFRMREYENILISMREEMLSVMMRRIEEFSQKIENAGRVLESLDPKKPLNRGFAMIFKNGKLITSSSSLKKGDRVCVVMKDGDREAVIE